MRRFIDLRLLAAISTWLVPARHRREFRSRVLRTPGVVDTKACPQQDAEEAEPQLPPGQRGRVSFARFVNANS